MKYFLWFLLNLCAVNVFLGWALKRIAGQIASYGEPLPLPPSKPKDYNPGDWLR